ncbi:hypothetical protein BC835DRAFT_1521174 [Cytidiella melzeri]|nr:hypothetical protein BC835DRAFT_1521174 [Cytidiella melzeri]
MAALYLHQALFADETQPHRPTRAHQGRQLPSISSATLNTVSENSHAPLVDTLAESSAYLDLLTRQPPHPSDGSPRTELSLQGDPLTDRERKRQWERVVRKRLRRLKWARRVLRVVIAGWATYNTTRYFLAFTIYTSHDRQVILLVLGSVAVLSLALALTSQLLRTFAPHFGWNHATNSLYSRTQICLNSISSILLLGPAVVNVVFVVLWRRSPDKAQSLQGRCHWDIDVVWSGTGFECDAATAIDWGFWLAGALVRLVLTALILGAYHYVLYAYSVTRRPSRRRMGRSQSHSQSSTGYSHRHAPSFHSSRTMTSTTTMPVSLANNVRRPSFPNSDSEHTRETSSISTPSEHHGLRRSASRVTTEGQTPGETRVRPTHISFSRPGLSSNGHSFRDETIPASPTSSEDEYTNDTEADAYGLPIRRGLSGSAYTAVGPSIQPPHHDPLESSESIVHDDLQIFGDHLSGLMEEVAQETEEGLRLAQNDRPGYYASFDHDDNDDATSDHQPYGREELDDNDYVPVVGRIIQRMPTIESLGSREVTSLASWQQRGDRSVHTLSRPPTRATVAAGGSQPPSRSNSLTASIMLSTSSGAGQPGGEGPPLGDFGGTLTDSPRGSGGSVSYHGGGGGGTTKSTLSYYTAVGGSGSTGSGGGSVDGNNGVPVASTSVGR